MNLSTRSVEGRNVTIGSVQDERGHGCDIIKLVCAPVVRDHLLFLGHGRGGDGRSRKVKSSVPCAFVFPYAP